MARRRIQAVLLGIYAMILCFLVTLPVEWKREQDSWRHSYLEAKQSSPISPRRVEEILDFKFPTRYSRLDISEEDIDLIARLVYLEARGESEEGQRAVVEVVLNRVLSSRFPNTVYDVIYQKGQFTPAGRLTETAVTEAQRAVVLKVLKGEDYILEPHVVFFSTHPYNSSIYAHIGGHYFCSLTIS